MAAADQKPYVGPRPFGRDEQDLFFGRDRETRRVTPAPARMAYLVDHS
jgi:hypothetical protein